MFHIQSCHDIIFQISSNEGTYPTWKPVATVSLWSDVFTGTLCGLLAQGWANPVGESWDFAESSIPSLISVVVARVFMFTTGQLNICCDESSLHYETNWLNHIKVWVTGFTNKNRVVYFKRHSNFGTFGQWSPSAQILNKNHKNQIRIILFPYSCDESKLQAKITGWMLQIHNLISDL